MAGDATGAKIVQAELPAPDPTPAPAPAPPGASAFSRGCWLAYAMLIVYASLYPFSGWQQLGVPLEGYLLAPLPPRYWTVFDVAVNIAGYIPFGVLTVFALYPLRRVPAVLLAICCGILMSGSMEAVQTLLPNRVASNMDLLTNSAGALVGALIGAFSSRAILQSSRLQRLRHRWFAPAASRGLIVLALWPLAQIYPQSSLFGNGQLLPILSDWLGLALDMPVDLGEWLRQGVQLSADQYTLAEATITACGMTAGLLTLSCGLRERSPRVPLVLALLAAAIVVKTLASALLFTPENAFAWATPGAETGLLVGAVLLAGMIFLPAAAQRRLAILLLALGLLMVNVVPANPYFVVTLEAWVQGKFLNFNGAAQFLSLFWPFLALWFLLHRVHRVK